MRRVAIGDADENMRVDVGKWVSDPEEEEGE